MNNKEWLSIKEFSEMAGVTPQAIYKRLNQEDSTLKPLVKTVKNRKVLNIRALEEFDSTEFNNQTTNPLNQVETVESSENLKEIIDLLKNQMKIMDNQTDVLRNQLEKKDKQIDDLNNRLEQALKNTSEGHFVLAQHQQKSIEDPQEENRPWYRKLFRK